VSIANKVRSLNRLEAASVAFFGIAGVFLLVSLPFSGYPPHIGFLAIVSLITAYSLFVKRAWAPWLVGFLFIVNSAFALFTLYVVGLSNVIVALGMIGLVVLTWVLTIFMLLKRKS
jgi:hypothetical protein